MVEIRGPHIPYKQWAAQGTPDPVQDHMNWLEVERWAARLSEQINAYSWGVSLGSGQETLDPGTQDYAQTYQVFHTTLGAATDFYEQSPTQLQPLLPRDGLYAISTLVGFTGIGSSTTDADRVEARIQVDGPGGTLPAMVYRSPLFGATAPDLPYAAISLVRMCVPGLAGDLVTLTVANDTAGQVGYLVNHFDAVYVGELVDDSGRVIPT